MNYDLEKNLLKVLYKKDGKKESCMNFQKKKREN